MNAMAISLNEGSLGLLMDPLNGAADIESRTLRLVSNYGFLEDPSLLIRATRYRARLGWEFDPKTAIRYENAKNEGVIESISSHARSRELEQIGHEEDGLKVLRALEAEGWMKVLFPAWTSAKADEDKLRALHEIGYGLLLQGVHADMSAAQMQLLTAKVAPKDLKALKKLMLRPGFVEEWESLDAVAAGFAKVLLAKQNATPSASFKLFTSYDPEAVLWLGFTSKAQAVLERYNLFLEIWPEARQRIPHALMHEMRITPELPAYSEIVQAIFLELIDGHLATPEEMRAYLEPFSPPAPPPQATIRRPRAKRGVAAKLKEESFDEEEEGLAEDDLESEGGDEDEIDLGEGVAKDDLDTEMGMESQSEELELEEVGDEPVPAAEKKPAGRARIPASTAAGVPAVLPKAEKPKPTARLKPAPVPAPAGKTAPMQAAPVGKVSAPARAKAPAAAKKKPAPISSPAKGKASPTPAKRPLPVKPQDKHPRKESVKVAVKAAAKKAAKAVNSRQKPAPAVGAKSARETARSKHSGKAAKKPAPKPAKKR